MADIAVYKNNPTAGGTDGTQVSEGTELSPIDSGYVNATNNTESAAIKLAVRCVAGKKALANATITPTGTTAAKWALSRDNITWSNYGAALTITDEVPATNIIFYAKAKATSDESVQNDTGVNFQVDAEIAAA